MPAQIKAEHIDFVKDKVSADLREKLPEAVAAAEEEECVTYLTYKVKVDAAKPKRENERTKEAQKKKPLITVERVYEPPPVKEKNELLTMSIVELPLLDEAKV